MDKILIKVLLPSANRSFEVYIPLDLKFYEITLLVCKIVSDELVSIKFILDICFS